MKGYKMNNIEKELLTIKEMKKRMKRVAKAIENMLMALEDLKNFMEKVKKIEK